MSERRKYFHIIMILVAMVIGGLSFWHSGFWMEGRNNVPNFSAMAMVLLVFSQGVMLRVGLKEKGKK